MSTIEELQAQQTEHWNGPGGERWAEEHENIDKLIRPLGLAAIDRLAPQAGEAILDVGCGFGATALEIGRRVTDSGRVLGVDLSGPQLGVARAHADRDGLGHVSFAQGDAAAHTFDETHHGAFSRFGVMFFPDPVAAFTNVRSSLVDGGRLVFLCWRSIADNDWVRVPMEAAAKHVPLPEPSPPGAPGPFSLAEADRIRTILSEAGFDEIAVEAMDQSVTVGSDAAEAADWFLRVGPVSRMADGADETVLSAIVESMTRAFEPLVEDEGVSMPTASWIVTARR